MKRPSTQAIAYAGIALLGVLWFTFYQRVPAFSEDTHCYTALAQSLRVNGTYEFNFVPHSIYPPGFPALLAGLSWLAGKFPVDSYSIFIRFIGVAAALTLLVGYVLIRRHTTESWGLVYVLLVGFSSYMVVASTRFVGSDVPYTLASLTAVLLFELLPAAAERRGRGQLVALYLLLALLLLASLAFRAVGKAMLGGLALWLVVSSLRRWRRLPAPLMVILLVGLVAQMAWSEWVKEYTPALAPGEYNYAYDSDLWQKDPHRPDMGPATAVDLAMRPVWRFGQEVSHFTEFFAANHWINPLPYSPLIVVPAILIATGWAAAVLAPGAGFMEYYFISFVGISLVWPFDQGPRYIFPVLPLCFIYSWNGWQWIKRWSRTEQRRMRWVLASLSVAMLAAAVIHRALGGGLGGVQAMFAIVFWAVCALLAARAPQWPGNLPRLAAAAGWAFILLMAASSLPAMGRMGRENVTQGETDQLHYPTVAVSRWLVENTRTDAVVMTFNPWMVHARTGRRTVMFPPTARVLQIMQVARSNGVSYLVILHHTWYVPSQEQRLKLLEETYPAALEQVAATKDYQVFRLRVN